MLAPSVKSFPFCCIAFPPGIFPTITKGLLNITLLDGGVLGWAVSFFLCLECVGLGRAEYGCMGMRRSGERSGTRTGLL